MADNNKDDLTKPTLPGTPDFMARLRDNISHSDLTPRAPPVPPADVPEEVKKYAPLAIRREQKNKTRNQTIAEFILSLPYREAMAMGAGIMEKMEEAEGRPTVEQLTKAIQDWAWNWEIFEDEERPKQE